MAQGSKILTINQDDFIKGMTSSDVAQDGGFSDESTNANPTIKRGAMYATDATGTTLSAALTGTIIASADDANYLGNDKYFLGSDGKYYTWDGTTLTLRQTDSTNTYQIARSDMVQFNLSVFATSTTEVIKLDNSNLTAIDDDWWTVAQSKTGLTANVPHPLLQFENNLHIGDKNMVHTWDGSTSSFDVVNIINTNTITALGEDPGSGNMLIACVDGFDTTSRGVAARVYVWDGFSIKPNFVYPVDDIITSFRTVAGVAYAFSTTSVGFWNGGGVTYLRPLNVTNSMEGLVYKHKTTDFNNTLFYVEGTKLRAFGNIYEGNKVFYPVLDVQDDIDTIASLGDNKIATANTGASTSTIKSLDTSAASNLMELYSRRYYFDRTIIIRSVTIEFDSAVGTGNVPFFVRIIDKTGTGTLLTSFVNDLSTNTHEITKTANNQKVDSFQIRLSGNQGATGVRKILVNYDFIE